MAHFKFSEPPGTLERHCARVSGAAGHRGPGGARPPGHGAGRPYARHVGIGEDAAQRGQRDFHVDSSRGAVNLRRAERGGSRHNGRNSSTHWLRLMTVVARCAKHCCASLRDVLPLGKRTSCRATSEPLQQRGCLRFGEGPSSSRKLQDRVGQAVAPIVKTKPGQIPRPPPRNMDGSRRLFALFRRLSQV